MRKPVPGTNVPIRLLTAVPLCDGHDSAISTVNLEFIRHGIEVVYLGYHRSVRDVVRAAVQEDVRAVGLSSYNGGHVEFFSAVVAGLREAGAGGGAGFGGEGGGRGGFSWGGWGGWGGGGGGGWGFGGGGGGRSRRGMRRS